MSKIKQALEKAKTGRVAAVPRYSDRRSEADEANAPQTKVINYTEEAVIKHRVITPYFEDRALTERFKLLRTKVFAETQKNDERTIMVTSSLDREGKTFIAVNLAITFAREVDQTVLLVDTNLKHPSVLEFFGIEQEKGLSDFLIHNIPVSELLVRPGIEKLVVLPAGKPLEHSAELLGSFKMQELVKEMKNRYGDRYIFFDAPALLSAVDAIVLSEYVDKTLFVVESGRVPPQKVTESLSRLSKRKILGTVLNKKDQLNL